MGLEDLFYTKKSLGKNGKIINVYKFRTMVPKEEQTVSLNELEHNGHGKPKNDPRVTKRGKKLRRLWIDEIPQIYNFLKGEIKLVGVRPMTEEDWKLYPQDIKEKSLEEKPGWGGQQYAHEQDGSFENCLERMREYVFWDGSHFKRDMIYFGKIVYRIIVKGVRSS